MTFVTWFSFIIISVFAYTIYIQLSTDSRRDNASSVYDDTTRSTNVHEPYSTYSFGDFFTTPQAQMPGYFEGTRTRCTDGCVYRTRNQGVSVDINCAQMCSEGDSPNELNSYINELTKSINSGAIVYDH